MTFFIPAILDCGTNISQQEKSENILKKNQEKNLLVGQKYQK